MKQNKIKVYLIEVDEKTGQPFRGSFKVIDNTLETLQRLVNFGRADGLISCIEMQGINFICHDEGKLNKFPLSRFIMDGNKAVDAFAGNVICCRNDADEFSSIREEDIKLIDTLLKPSVPANSSGSYIVIPTEDWLPTKEEFEHGEFTKGDDIVRLFSKGTRLVLDEDLDDPYTPKKAGDIFVCDGIVDDLRQIHGSWESGGSIALVIGKDKFHIIKD